MSYPVKVTPSPLAKPFELVEQACWVFQTTNKICQGMSIGVEDLLWLTKKVTVAKTGYKLWLAGSEYAMVTHEGYDAFHICAIIGWTSTPVSIGE